MAEPTSKPVHTLILDAAPLLKNNPPLSTLLAKSHVLVTSPSVLNEIRDATARARVETLYKPFLVLRTPQPDSLKVVSEFAKKTGDKSVLSSVDLELLAIAYEIECERNGGDWRLRRAPGQKGLNGSPPTKQHTESSADGIGVENADESKSPQTESRSCNFGVQNDTKTAVDNQPNPSGAVQGLSDQLNSAQMDHSETTEVLEISSVDDKPSQKQETREKVSLSDAEEEGGSDSDSDSEGWITPSNIKKHQTGTPLELSSTHEQKTLQVAMITGDFAMQNVLLQINLNLLSPNTLERIRHLRTFILRCHACFFTTKEMSKQFCPRCGKPTLTRVSCSTNANGEFKMHLKKNMTWNHRGDRYSVPKPVHGSSNGKLQNGGGKGGWAKELILSEDQKEYVKALKSSGQRSRKEHDLMDDDYLPSILTGERRQGGGKVKIGAGRNVNSRKR